METPGYAVGQSSGVDPERLRLLGKRASAIHTESGRPLTESVVEILGPEMGLTPEHVRRVTEHANNHMFEQAFAKSTGDHRVINFEGGPADSALILQELKSRGREDVMKTASRKIMKPNELFVPGADGLNYHQMEKTASPRIEDPWLNPHRELFELREKLKTAQSELSSRMFGLQTRYDAAVRSMRKEARAVVMEGYSPVEVSRVYLERASKPAMAKLALKLAAEGVDDLPAVSMTKKASAFANRTVNPEHPLCTSFDTFAKVAEEFYGTAAAVENIKVQLGRVNAEVRRVIQ